MCLPTDKQADAALFEVELEDTIVAIVHGLRGVRVNPVSRKNIKARLITYPMFKDVTVNQITRAIDEMLHANRIRIVAMSPSSHRRWNGAYGYVAS